MGMGHKRPKTKERKKEDCPEFPTKERELSKGNTEALPVHYS